MTGLRDTDIRLSDDWTLTQATSGDAPTLSDKDCLLQTIKLEALTQEGELFYDESWGWSLLDFIHSDDSDLIRLEIENRVKDKLINYEVIDVDTIQVATVFDEESFTVQALFSFLGSDEVNSVDIFVSRVNVEVVEND